MIHAGSCPRVRHPAPCLSGRPRNQPEDCKDLEDTKKRHEEKPEFPRLVPEDLHRGKCPERPEESTAQQGGFGDPPAGSCSPPLVSRIEEEYGSVDEKKEQYQNFNTGTCRHTR